MRYKVRAILKSKKTKDKKEYTVYVSVLISGGLPALISIVDKMPPKFWSTKAESVINHPMSDELNSKILATKKAVSDLILKYVLDRKQTTAQAIKTEFLSSSLVNIFDFADNYIKEMSHKRDKATLENVRKHILKLEMYNGSRNLHFENITAAFLNNYEAQLFKEKYSHNYVQLLIRTIRRMFQAALKIKIIDCYPFGAYEMLPYKAPDKQFPDALDLQRIKDFETSDPVLQEAKAWFVFGCHSGLRISDWHRVSSNPDDFIIAGRLKLHPKKKSTGFVSMPIYKELQEAITAIRATPFAIEEQTLNEKIKVIAKKQGIKKHFTAHSARHHFAVVQCLNKGISSETAAELMGITLETFVKNYSVVTEEKIDAETLRAWS